jgi:cytochrome b involved in lipid metabolism
MANLVTFKGETYDITDFIPNHPGGSVIQKAIGNDLTSLEEKWC